MDAVTPESIDYKALEESPSSWSPEGIDWSPKWTGENATKVQALEDEAKALMAKHREQEMVDLRALYHELSEGTFYEDYDEANRLMGVLRRHLERLERLERLDQRPGK